VELLPPQFENIARKNYSSPRASRVILTLCAMVWPPVSLTRCSRFHGSYSREETSSQVGGLNPGMSTIRSSTRRRCSLASTHLTSTSTKRTRAAFATATQASRVNLRGLTESATTVRPIRRLSSATAYATRYPTSLMGRLSNPESRMACSTRVYTQMHGADLTGQLPRYGRLPGSG
jgi:hypothetical protein